MGQIDCWWFISLSKSKQIYVQRHNRSGSKYYIAEIMTEHLQVIYSINKDISQCYFALNLPRTNTMMKLPLFGLFCLVGCGPGKAATAPEALVEEWEVRSQLIPIWPVHSKVQDSLVHSHWSRNVEARLSLVESFPSDAYASSLMP